MRPQPACHGPLRGAATTVPLPRALPRSPPGSSVQGAVVGAHGPAGLRSTDRSEGSGFTGLAQGPRVTSSAPRHMHEDIQDAAAAASRAGEKSPGETHRELAGLSAGCLCRVRPPTACTRPRDTGCPPPLAAGGLLGSSALWQPCPSASPAPGCSAVHNQPPAASRSRFQAPPPWGQDPGGWGLGAAFVKQSQDSFYSSKSLSIPVCSPPRCLLICVQEAW